MVAAVLKRVRLMFMFSEDLLTRGIKPRHSVTTGASNATSRQCGPMCIIDAPKMVAPHFKHGRAGQIRLLGEAGVFIVGKSLLP